jgi:hypothetical protein
MRLCALRALSPTMSANPSNATARIIAPYGCRQRRIGENNEYSLLQATNAMSAEANIQNTQYKPQIVNRTAAVNDTKYVDRGDINRRLPYVPVGNKLSLGTIVSGTGKPTGTKVSSGSRPVYGRRACPHKAAVG